MGHEAILIELSLRKTALQIEIAARREEAILRFLKISEFRTGGLALT